MKALWRFITFIPRWWLNFIDDDDEPELTFIDWVKGTIVFVICVGILWVTFMIA